MDKVIIDGIDVNKCGYYKDGDCLLSPVTCEEFIDCDFKEIKRLQAENEELKNQYRFSTILKIDKLEQENERLKEELRAAQMNRITMFEKLDIVNKKDTYKQALQEIRDIILSPEIIDEETKKLHTSEELDNIVRWHREDKLSKIQAKINEVIGEKE